jgi:hypothetical protein
MIRPYLGFISITLTPAILGLPDHIGGAAPAGEGDHQFSAGCA